MTGKIVSLLASPRAELTDAAASLASKLVQTRRG